MSPHPHLRLLVASTPGGQAPRYRVQIQSTDQAGWSQFASFGTLESAESCVSDLQARGIDARVVAARIYPVAA